eukprot:COSAG02_NODE_6517_length_3523_cov_13.416472_1_plen_829_part_10
MQHSYLPVRRLFELRENQRMQGTALSGTRPDDTPLHGLVAATGKSPIIMSAFHKPMLPHQLAAIEMRKPSPPRVRLPGIGSRNSQQVSMMARVNSYHEIPKESSTSRPRRVMRAALPPAGKVSPKPEEKRGENIAKEYNWARARRYVQMSSILGSNISSGRRKKAQVSNIAPAAEPPCAVKEPRTVSREGVSLGFLKHIVQWSMASQYPRTMSDGREVHSYRELTCEDIVNILVLPRTHDEEQQESCSYTEILVRNRQAYDNRPAAGRATVFVTYCRRYLFVELVEALSDFQDKYMWIDMWSVDQTELIKNRIDAEWLTALEKTAKEIAHTVVVFDQWESAMPLSRLWCLYELAITAGTYITFGVVLIAQGASDLQQAMMKSFKQLADSVQIDFANANIEDDNERSVLIGALGDDTLIDRQSDIESMIRDWLADQGRKAFRSMPSELRATSDLAEQLVEQLKSLGRLTEALPLTRQRLAGAKMKHGENSKESLACMHTLGELHHLRWVCKDGDAYNELSLALPLLSESLRGRRELFGSMDINTLSTADKLALVHYDMGDLESAQALAEEAVAGFTKLLGDNHLYLLTAKQNLGQILRELDLLDRALPLHVEAYEGKQRAYGPDSPETIDSASALGLLYAARGENGSAAEALRTAFKSNCAVRGNSHPSTIMDAKKLRSVLINLKATSVNETGVYNLELAELDKFIDGERKNSTGVLAQLDSMASTSVRGRRGENLEIMESVYDDCRKSHGNHDPRTLECLALIGWHHHVHGTNSNIAVNNLRQALVGLTNLVDENGVHHPLVPKVAKQLSVTLEKLSQQEVDGHQEQVQ